MDSNLIEQLLSTLQPCKWSSTTYIPFDIIVDILSLLPVKSILRFKSVSKSWCKTIEDPSLSDRHLSQATEEPGMLFPLKKKQYGTFLPTHKASLCFVKDDEPKGSRIIRAPFGDDYYKLEGSCNGLVCLFALRGNPKPAFICNLALQEYITLPVDDLQAKANYSVEHYQLVFCPESKVYKVVWYFTNFRSLDSYKHSRIKMHTLGSSSWRDILCPRRPFYGNPVLANGGLHWEGEEGHYASLDVENEEFYVTEYPISGLKNFEMNLFEMRGYLALADFSFSDHMDIWVRNDKKQWVKECIIMITLNNSPDAWEKELVVPPAFYVYRLKVVGLWKPNKILFQYTEHYVSYDTKTYEVVNIEGFGEKALGIGSACSYTRSLVSLKPYGCKRI